MMVTIVPVAGMVTPEVVVVVVLMEVTLVIGFCSSERGPKTMKTWTLLVLRMRLQIVVARISNMYNSTPT